ncbi:MULTISPECIES: SDR family oxidoreductase [Nocardia]|uniref:SDR family oxidoreductase n=1 Tax=Nocardia TaxID=1817 RepID=UPI0007EB4D2A|nr:MULTISPECIES: SDR family oxidoreductase [Nocardia]MBF6276421.1 SDR family oxidoreductase [Nocardia nova]OBA45976.1 NAD-dependent epimerase [Nocardia sp. 852002-51101_SCH5132738]OBB38561.1 NAD-dependent epimerase [Nocardia sp. 852002-51244_SCH5132740]OBF82963.1 NAD-dependent epimerase [Mycobacterium sp. 852002-51759_SCH5129042]
MGTIAVTGSASGIGAAVAVHLEKEGHRVIGVDLRDAEVTADLGTAEGRAHAVAEVSRISAGRLDGFLPFAGVAAATGRPGGLVVSVNYFGAIALLEGLRPLLRESGNASVVLVSSNSTTTQPLWPVELADACLAGDEERARGIAESFGDLGAIQAYPATKAALAWYARTKSAEYIADGIRLNAIAPGIIDTPMTQEGSKDALTGEGMKQFLAMTPIGRPGRPEEIADLAAFLLSDKAGFFVGSVIFCDGGIDAAFRGKDWPAVWNPQQ